MTLHPYTIKIEDFDYPLTDNRIAKFPLENRDDSKLLFLKDSEPVERKFKEIHHLLPKKSLLVFNETRVIQARLIFKKKTGAIIEIFCLEPILPVNDFQLAFQQKGPVVWKCFVGNAKRWKSEALELSVVFNGEVVILKAEKKQILSEGFLIEFSWSSENYTFSQMIEKTGLVPIPPYLNRESVASDKYRYQTIYAKITIFLN